MAEINNVIAEASQDLQTIEDFVNLPADSEVYPRLLPSVNVGTLAGARQAIFEAGGLPAKPFATKALMEASELVDGQYAMVTDDTVNNGLYVKTAGVWVKSSYDVTNIAKIYVDDIAEPNDNDSFLFIFEDADGFPVATINREAGFSLQGLQGSVQTNIELLNKKIKEDDGGDFIVLEDENGDTFPFILGTGELLIKDVLTRDGSVNKRLRDIEGRNQDVDNNDYKADLLKSMDYVIASRDENALLQPFDIFTHTELDAVYAFAPSLCRISKNEYLVFCEARNGGDFGESWLVQRKLTINDDYTSTLGVVSIFANRGTEEGQPFSCINTCVVKVETGVHTGRIYVYYLKVFYQNQRDVTFYKYSDDNGETWSAEIDMTSFFPEIANWKLVVPGAGGKAIQLKEGAHRGRIIIPCWHGDEQYYDHVQTGLRSFILYSDDGGETYQIGAKSSFAGSNECQVAELDGGGFMLLTRDASTLKKTEVSFDGGLTLEQPKTLSNINTNKVESGFCQFKNIYDLSVPKLMITSPTIPNRYNLGLYASYDNGNRFDLIKVLSTTRDSYSDLLPIDESHILTAHTAGDGDLPDKSIRATIVNLKSILLGE